MRALGAFEYAAVALEAACIEHGELSGQIGEWHATKMRRLKGGVRSKRQS
jgi:hypothetical protein